MKVVFTGIESSGKSLQLSIQADIILRRNIKWFRVTGIPRTMAFNQPMSSSFKAEIESHGIKYLEFRDLTEILKLQDADIFIDELIKFFPASGSNPLSREQLDFLTQGAKSGIHIFAASQDFSQVHKQFRLLVNRVYVVSKLIGSPRPMRSAPAVKRIWGICFKREVAPSSFKGDSATMESSWIPWPFMIWKRDTDRFDTTYKIPVTKLPPKVVRKQKFVGFGEDGEIEYEKVMWV